MKNKLYYSDIICYHAKSLKESENEAYWRFHEGMQCDHISIPKKKVKSINSNIRKNMY